MAENRRVALVHGWGGSHAATFRATGWDDALRDAGLVPIGIDLPGHADPAASDDPAAYADLASALAAGLPDDVDMAIGFSLGTKLLLELEARRPGRFRRLVLGGIGDNIFAPEGAAAAVCAVLRGHAALSAAPAGVQALVRYSEHSGSRPEALAAVLERSPNPVHSPDRLSRICARLLVVNAMADGVAMPDGALLDCLPDAQVLHLEGGDHIGLPADAAFRQAAIAFLTGGHSDAR